MPNIIADVYNQSFNGGTSPKTIILWLISIICPNGLIFWISKSIPSTSSTDQKIGDRNNIP